jgi:hypothetical protein
VEDQDKLYEKFKNTLSQDELNGVLLKKKGHIFNKEEQDVVLA